MHERAARAAAPGRALVDLPRRASRTSNATIEAYAALRLAGLSRRRAPQLAAPPVLRGAGRHRRRACLHPHLARRSSGSGRGTRCPQLPPELVLLRPSVPVSVYTFACWARQTVRAARGRHALPPGPAAAARTRACHELDLGPPPSAGRTSGTTCDRLLAAATQARPSSPAASARSRVAERWIVDRQELDGSLGRDPAAVGLVADRARLPRPRARLAVPAPRARGLEAASSSRTATACAPRRASRPSGTRGLALLGLARRRRRRPTSPALAPGVRVDPRARRCAPRGDWAVRRPGVEPGGWSFEYDNDLYPDVDDAAVVALALDELGTGRGAVERACRWIAGMQCANGGWGAFDVDNDAVLALRHPVLRLRRRHRPAERRRHRARRRAARARGRLRGRRAPRRRLPAAPSRRRTAPGSAAGASTTSTAPAPLCPRSRRPASRPTTRRCAAPSTGSRRTRTRTAASARTAAPTTAARRASPGAAAASRRRRRPPGR